MEPKVFVESEREIRLADSLRQLALQRIGVMGDLDQVADRLDAPRVGVQSLLARRSWDLQTAFRVAEALDLEVLDAIEQASVA